MRYFLNIRRKGQNEKQIIPLKSHFVQYLYSSQDSTWLENSSYVSLLIKKLISLVFILTICKVSDTLTDVKDKSCFK
jgi:hypothetical protein